MEIVIYNTKMTDEEKGAAKQKLLQLASEDRGKKRVRYVDHAEIDKALRLIESGSIKKYARVYSKDGFVPNSYKYNARISCVLISRNGDTYEMTIRRVSAFRAYGDGPLVVVDNRAAE